MPDTRHSPGVMAWCLVLLLCLTGLSEATAQQGWSVEQFTAENGLPQNSVGSLAFDSSGYLWITTEGGLVRYDGRSMRVFSTRTDTVLRDDRMRYLLMDRSGALFVNDAIGSLYRVRTGALQLVMDGRGPEHSLAVLSGGIPSLEDYRVFAQAPPDEQRWRAWDTRVLPLPEGGFAALSEEGLQLTPSPTSALTIPVLTEREAAFMVGEELFILDRAKMIYRVDRRTASLEAVRVEGIDARLVERMLWTSTSAEVFATGAGRLWRVISHADRRLTFEELRIDLPVNTRINALLLAPDGNTLFVGTSTQGLFRYTRHRFRTLLPVPGTNRSGDNAFYAQAVLESGRVLTSHGTVCGPDGFEPELFPVLPCEIQALHRDRQGRIWSVNVDSVRVQDARTGSTIHHQTSAAGSATAFLEEEDTLWLAGMHGLEAWVGLVPRLMLTHHAVSYRDNPFALLRGPDGLIWWATGQGVFRVRGQVLEPVPGLERTYARTLARWGDRVLVGTYGEGPLVVDKGKVIRLPLDPQGSLSHVHAFIPDAKDRLWMPTNHGLFVVGKEALEAYLSGRRPYVAYRSFGHDDGLGTLEFNGGCSPPYVRLPSGEVSLPTIDGLVRFDPNAIADGSEVFQPFVDAVQLNDSLVPVTGSIYTLGRLDRLTLWYSLPNWTDPVDLQMYYRVQGLDSSWIPLDMASGRITVERLPPGDHLLQMMRPEATYEVRDLLRVQVLAPWYWHPWALTSGALLLLGLGWSILRLRTGQLLRARTRLEAIVNDRTEALQRSNTELTRALTVKDRLISILSHDIVSPLRFISRVATRTLRSARSEQPEVLRHTLAEISTSSEKLYANASNILEWIRNQGGEIAVIPAEVEIRVLTEEVLAQFQQHASTVRFINEVPPHDHVWVDPRLFGIVLQNLVANAAGHAGGLVTVEGGRSPAAYRITVKDNGPGISASAQARLNALREGAAEVRTATDRPGLGYMIIHDILALLEADYRIETPPSGGTWVHVFLPDRAAEEQAETPAP